VAIVSPKKKQMARFSPQTAFINIPHDDRFQDLYLAFIAGLSAFGLDPRATLEVPGGTRRLDRIYELITSCQYSFHDLSRVQLDTKPPRTPRFNMPFELGLVLGWLKSLSDLNGTDPYIHDGRPKGVFRELGNALVRNADQPTMQQMNAIYKSIKNDSPLIVKNTGARSHFEARVFKQLVVLARKYTELARTTH
jgi:hypothetical protein